MSANRIVYPAHKRITAAAILAILALWAASLVLWPNSGAATPGAGIGNGGPAPDFELKTIDGKSYRLSDLKGRAVMINFFATWCPPCRAEMPALQEAFAEYESQGFLVLAVNLNETSIAIRAFQDRLGITFPVVVDKDDRVSRLYDIIPLPTSYFLDREGIVQGKWMGEIRKDQLREMLMKIL